MAGYIRQDTTGAISTNSIIEADDLNNEFDAVVGAFSATTGHKHDGTSAEGAPIVVVGPAQDVVVTSSTVRPKTDDTMDLGTPTLEFRDLYIDGTANIDNLSADAGTVGGAAITTVSNTQALTNKTLNLSDNTLIATSAQLAAALTNETGTGFVVFSASPALTGTPTAPTAAVGTNTTQIATTAHVFAERSSTSTLTNKTLTNPAINGGTITNITDLAIADGGTGASTAAGALANFGLTASANEINYSASIAPQISGRNLIINGSGRINQRVYVSGTATTGANQFTLDRWFVVTSGQNLAFTGNDSRRVMTAPAGGVRQVIEGSNIVGGDYVLNWDGTATATVNGTARTKGQVFTLTANTNVVVAFSGGTFTDVQLERGTVATPFELRSIGQELALCQRYYAKSYELSVAPGTIADFGAIIHNTPVTTVRLGVQFPVQMRGTPAIVWFNPETGASGSVRDQSGGANLAAPAAGFVSEKTVFTSGVVAAGADREIRAHYTADAELTS
jgi:hypothetical protein